MGEGGIPPLPLIFFPLTFWPAVVRSGGGGEYSVHPFSAKKISAKDWPNNNEYWVKNCKLFEILFANQLCLYFTCIKIFIFPACALVSAAGVSQLLVDSKQLIKPGLSKEVYLFLGKNHQPQHQNQIPDKQQTADS